MTNPHDDIAVTRQQDNDLAISPPFPGADQPVDLDRRQEVLDNPAVRIGED